MIVRRLILAVALLLCPALANAADINALTWSETDASNNAAAPNGWTSGVMTPNQVSPTARAMMGAIKRWYDHIQPTVTSGGSANIQTLTYSVSPAAYVSGDVYTFIAGASNSGATTLNINSLGAKAVQRAGIALAGGEIVSGRVVSVRYDGTLFQLIDTLLSDGGNATTAALQTLANKASGLTGDSFSLFSMKVDANSITGRSTPVWSILNTSSEYVFRVYAGGYISANTNSSDGYTQGPPMVVGFNAATPANNTYIGHFAYQGNSSDHQLQTMSFMEAEATNVSAASMNSEWRVGVMKDSVSSPGTVGQPNWFTRFNKTDWIWPGVAVSGATTITATSNIGTTGGNFVANGKSVLTNGANVTQVYDDSGNVGIGLGVGYNAYQNTVHRFYGIGGSGEFLTVQSHQTSFWTGADNNATVSRTSDNTTYSLLSLNNIQTQVGAQGIMGGSNGGADMYLVNKTAGTLGYLVNGSQVWGLSATGVINAPGTATGTPAASLCLDSSNNIIKKTTPGACI